MKIKDSKNLKYDRIPWRGPLEGYEKFEPRICFLKKFNRTDDIINLYFKNESQAAIKGFNIEGGREIDLVESKLNNYLGKSYEEILEYDF